MRTDKAYRQNQKEAQKRWHKSNPEYYQNYRKKNSEYTAKNRLAQAALTVVTIWPTGGLIQVNSI